MPRPFPVGKTPGAPSNSDSRTISAAGGRWRRCRPRSAARSARNQQRSRACSSNAPVRFRRRAPAVMIVRKRNAGRVCPEAMSGGQLKSRRSRSVPISSPARLRRRRFAACCGGRRAQRGPFRQLGDHGPIWSGISCSSPKTLADGGPMESGRPSAKTGALVANAVDKAAAEFRKTRSRHHRIDSGLPGRQRCAKRHVGGTLFVAGVHHRKLAGRQS